MNRQYLTNMKNTEQKKCEQCGTELNNTNQNDDLVLCKKCKEEYDAKRNRRRYKLHFNCRKNNVGIDTRHKTCSVVHGKEINKFVSELVEKFNYSIQRVIFVDDKRAKINKEL